MRGRVALCLGTANATARAPGDASVPIKPPSFNLLVHHPDSSPPLDDDDVLEPTPTALRLVDPCMDPWALCAPRPWAAARMPPVGERKRLRASRSDRLSVWLYRICRPANSVPAAPKPILLYSSSRRRGASAPPPARADAPPVLAGTHVLHASKAAEP